MKTRFLPILTLLAVLVQSCASQLPAPSPTAPPLLTSTSQPPPTATQVQPQPTPTNVPTLTVGEAAPELAWDETTADWEELSCGEFLLVNNVWGKEDLTGYSQSIGIAGEPDACRFRWSWDWPRTSVGSVRAYPEIIYGWKPWSPASTTSSLPIQLSALEELEIDLKYNSQADGRYNTAFDLWLTSTNPPTGETITREIMIWVGEAQMTPAGSRVASLEIDGIPYSLYKVQMDWTYLAFIQETQEPTEIIPIARLLDYLIENQHLQADEYLASIEFGNEIVYGSGQTQVDKFTVTLK
jgi:hypothetical protein